MAMAEPETGAHRQRIEAAVNAPNVPKYYVNGFANSLSSSDIIVVLETNGLPTAVLNMSYTVAKTLSQKLGVLVANLETLTGREMLTTDEIGTAISEDNVKENK
jgi:hypothetical protein